MDTITDKTDIEKLIFSFSDAFNTSDISKVVLSYTQDGVLMPNNGPAAKGQEQIKATYEFLLKNFNIHIEYFIAEVIVSGDYGFVQTTSKVKTLILASGQTIVLENKELFVVHKDNGQWKISHYIFNSNSKN